MPPVCDLGGFDWFAMFIGIAVMMAFLPLAFAVGWRLSIQDDFPDPFAEPYGDDPGVPHG
ncbi:hypothetical protein [Ancylobacter sp.]|uniref:hypothetical protein n=1 Tax=Ancylobacter sp. TaxID=1872567 RepID=UPI003D0DEBA8